MLAGWLAGSRAAVRMQQQKLSYSSSYAAVPCSCSKVNLMTAVLVPGILSTWPSRVPPRIVYLVLGINSAS